MQLKSWWFKCLVNFWHLTFGNPLEMSLTYIDVPLWTCRFAILQPPEGVGSANLRCVYMAFWALNMCFFECRWYGMMLCDIIRTELKWNDTSKAREGGCNRSRVSSSMSFSALLRWQATRRPPCVLALDGVVRHSMVFKSGSIGQVA